MIKDKHIYYTYLLCEKTIVSRNLTLFVKTRYRFKDYQNIKHKCIVRGDSKYMSIAAASILAKTFRDDYMINLHLQYPSFNWKNNKGYPTPEHKKAITKFGITPFHRTSFNLNEQLKLTI